jgi:hypothetical protein
MFQIIFGLKISLRDFIIMDTLLILLANDCTWEFHFNVSVIVLHSSYILLIVNKTVKYYQPTVTR